MNKNDLQNYIDDDEDDEEEEEEGDEEDELDEARYNQLLAEDAAMMAISNKKCNDWLNNHVMPFFNSATSSPINGDYDSNDIDDDNEGENIINYEY